MATVETRQRVLENRLRRLADRNGYRLAKDGPDAFLLTESKSRKAVLGLDRGRVFTASLDRVQAFLEKEEKKRTV